MPARLHPSDPVVSSTGFDAALVGRVLDDALAHACRVYAIAGLQGSGKSTLAAQVAALGATRGLNVAVLSIDDFYLARRERLRLGRDVHPLLATRGPPGTHDVALACTTLAALRAGAPAPVAVPRFDKLADTRLPPSRWRRLRAVDLTVFEGWFLKTPAQSPEALHAPLNAVERDEDPDGRWRAYCNLRLGRDYPALWQCLDRMLFLQPPGFDSVPQWRWQQEQAMAARSRRPSMTRPQLERFVQLFERVSRQALRCLPDIADWTLPLDEQRRPRT